MTCNCERRRHVRACLARVEQFKQAGYTWHWQDRPEFRTNWLGKLQVKQNKIGVAIGAGIPHILYRWRTI